VRIIPIASGKGGVGKSLVAANLSIALAKAGKRVILADLDLGASNLHLILGQQSPKTGIGTFMTDSSRKFEDIVLPTEFPGLSFIPGDSEIPGMANLHANQKNRLVKRLLTLEADYLILDLGAGTGANILDFFLISGQGIVVTTPAVTAVLNAYLFLKNALFRLMYTSFKPSSIAYRYLEQLRKEGNALQKIYLPKLLEKIAKDDPESYAAFMAKRARFRPRLILNMIEDPKDAEKAIKIRRSASEYLGLELEHLGIIYRDTIQDVALSARMPVIVYKPQSILSQAVCRIADKVIQSQNDEEGPLDRDSLEESYQEATVEAQIDFENKLDYVEDLLHSGALSMGDLIETVKSQQYELNQLKKENQFLKFKLTKAIQAGFKP
jgi:flagellar biosynthesis protein FlhG